MKEVETPPKPELSKTESNETTENPFKDNLANSVALPVTQKLDVKIDENYLTQFSQEENEATKTHNANIQKRKNNRGK